MTILYNSVSIWSRLQSVDQMSPAKTKTKRIYIFIYTKRIFFFNFFYSPRKSCLCLTNPNGSDLHLRTFSFLFLSDRSLNGSFNMYAARCIFSVGKIYRQISRLWSFTNNVGVVVIPSTNVQTFISSRNFIAVQPLDDGVGVCILNF